MLLIVLFLAAVITAYYVYTKNKRSAEVKEIKFNPEDLPTKESVEIKFEVKNQEETKTVLAVSEEVKPIEIVKREQVEKKVKTKVQDTKNKEVTNTKKIVKKQKTNKNG
jgi:hypothetical protein